MEDGPRIERYWVPESPKVLKTHAIHSVLQPEPLKSITSVQIASDTFGPSPEIQPKTDNNVTKSFSVGKYSSTLTLGFAVRFYLRLAIAYRG